MTQKKSLFQESEGDDFSADAESLQLISDLQPGRKGDCFALLSDKQKGETRDGKPYYRCQFRDQIRTATAMIWSDSTWFETCEANWNPGDCFFLRCRYSETQYGPQIDIERIRPLQDEDLQAGFDPGVLLPKSRYDPASMFAELIKIVTSEVENPALQELVLTILNDHAEQVQTFPAASRNHHAYRSGFVEHVLSVTRTALHLAHKYRSDYAELTPPLSVDLVVAGAVLHDIGKLRELAAHPHGADYTAEGRLVGHILLGRDLVKEYARQIDTLDPETLLRLEHIIISHQNLPEWGSPIAPHTPEALLVHYADDIDAKFQMMASALREAAQEDTEFTSRNNPLRRSVFRGFT